VRTEAVAAERRPAAGMQTTAHVFKDLYRMRVARSLLVIDQDSCIRCGHCAWSCSDAHEDGISRLVRRGDKVVVRTEDAVLAPTPATAPLLVPNSCQHCKNPSCMIDCPTGAIGRDARGEVFIREDLCTGCGMCAKACPWDNIQIAPRGSAHGKDVKSKYPEVAVKCDLCSGVSGGPACVASCPTQAIVRIDPNAALAELRDLGTSQTRLGGAALAAASVLPKRSLVWPWIVGALFLGAALPALALGAWTSGIVAGALVVLLVAYAGLKRAPGPVQRVRARCALARPLYAIHLGIGAFTIGAIVAHSGTRSPSSAGGALLLAMILALATGALGAATHVLVPKRLSRLER
jgi:Fe-S-cluster-containing dehydrogenase component